MSPTQHPLVPHQHQQAANALPHTQQPQCPVLQAAPVAVPLSEEDEDDDDVPPVASGSPRVYVPDPDAQYVRIYKSKPQRVRDTRQPGEVVKEDAGAAGQPGNDGSAGGQGQGVNTGNTGNAGSAGQGDNAGNVGDAGGAGGAGDSGGC